MADFSFYVEVVKVVGYPALLFIVWYVYHKSTSRQYQENQKASAEQWQQLIKQMQERDVQQQKTDNDQWKQLFEQASRKEQERFELLKSALETVQMHTMILAGMRDKIDALYNQAINRRDINGPI